MREGGRICFFMEVEIDSEEMTYCKGLGTQKTHGLLREGERWAE